MRSVDTNVLVRAFLNDVAEQYEIAREVLARPLLVTTTVVLELVWVLTSSRRQTREEVVANLRDLLEVRHIVFADAAAVSWALERYADGGDFADMLHLALSRGASSFVTFDQGIARHAVGSPVPVETL